MEISTSTLTGCVTSLETTTQLLQNSLNQLDSLMPDFQRLPLVLKQNKIFTIIPEFEIAQAKGTIQNEISPKLDRLIKMIQGRINKQERRVDGIKSKIQLNSVRIGNLERDEVVSSNNEINGTKEQLETLKRLKLKKERLRYKLSSLELQKRKNRLSMTGFKS